MLPRLIVGAVFLLTFASSAKSDDALIAVASNFAGVAQDLKIDFEATTGHRITYASGSTGKLYAQILHGAPFDALLAADQARPKLLESSDFGVAHSRFTFATGRLGLASAVRPLDHADIRANFEQHPPRNVAIANPELAPYGVASREVLQSLQLWHGLQHKLVLGENVSQAYAMIITGNAELGLVALSLLINENNTKSLDYVKIPATMHAPIHQDALLLAHGRENVAAQAFLAYLREATARTWLAKHGYGVD